MRTTIFATLGVASFIALGCADSALNAPTDPGLAVRAGKAGAGGTCSSTDSRTAKTELTYILASTRLKTAQALWKSVESACVSTDPDAANAELIAYAGYVRSQYPDNVIQNPKSGTPEANFLGHLNTIFSYVGYAAPSLGGGVAGPLQAGIVAVVPGSGGVREYQREHLGAFTLPEQGPAGDSRGHLFVMTDLGEQCLTVDNLLEVDDCIELKSYPSVSPRFSPGIKVGLCLTEGLTGMRLALGHETSGGTEIAGSATYPADCHANINVASTETGFDKAVTRLAKTFWIRSAYAGDKGLGGIGSTLSPFGVVESVIFGTGFNAPHGVGSAPVATEGNFTFTQTVTSPGSILVQNGLGDLTGPLAVLSQGGGACAACGGLELRTFFYSASGTPADDGVYAVSWKSVNSSPGVKGAPFVLRDNAAREIARLSYRTIPGGNQLVYNDVVVGSWARNVAQSFTINVNLNNKTTTLSIGGVPVAVATGIAFVNPAAANLYTLAAEFNGIDSGVMGWDDIAVQRVSDQPGS